VAGQQGTAGWQLLVVQQCQLHWHGCQQKAAGCRCLPRCEALPCWQLQQDFQRPAGMMLPASRGLAFNTNQQPIPPTWQQYRQSMTSKQLAPISSNSREPVGLLLRPPLHAALRVRGATSRCDTAATTVSMADAGMIVPHATTCMCMLIIPSHTHHDAILYSLLRELPSEHSFHKW
jgi:hypothetical protein